MPRAHRVHVSRDPRFNLAKHGRWVKVPDISGLTKIGRIAYYDRKTKLYNVAGMEDSRWWGGQYSPSQIRLLDWEAEPWYTMGKEKGHSDLRAEKPHAIITHVKVTSPDLGGKMARRKAVVEEIEDEDDFDDLDDPVEEEDEAPSRKRTKSATKAKKDEKPKGIGARQIAEHLNIDGKTFRAWLRRQVQAGEIDLNGREAKERYDFGPTMSSPLVQRIIKAWESTSHEKGEGLKKAQAANKAKREAKAKAEKSTAKKASSKKAVARKSR